MCIIFFFFFNDTATTEIYTLSLHDALPIYPRSRRRAEHPQDGRRRAAQVPRGRDDGRERGAGDREAGGGRLGVRPRSEEHTSELQSRQYLVCRLLLEKKKQDARLYRRE